MTKSTLSWMWIGIGVAAIAIWLLAMAAHGNAEEVQKIIPRGPGGPPVVVLEEAQPKWKIVVTLDGPPGKQELTYGNQLSGVHWFKDQAECEKARKGDDKEFAHAMAQVAKMQADFKKQKVPIEVTTACRMDNSV